MGKVWHDKCNSEVRCRTECRIQDEVLLGRVKEWAGKILSEPPPRREGLLSFHRGSRE